MDFKELKFQCENTNIQGGCLLDVLFSIFKELLERVEKLEAGWQSSDIIQRPTSHGWYDVILQDGTEQLLAFGYRGWIVPHDMDGPLLSTSGVEEFKGVVKAWRKH